MWLKIAMNREGMYFQRWL